MLEIIVFDFDGVIVDSNEIKRNAFFKLFPESDIPARNTVKIVMDNIGNAARFKILERVFRELSKPVGEINNLVTQYAARYNEMVQREIQERGFMPGVVAALENLFTRYSLYVNSATPEFALRETLERLRLNRFFKASYGSSASENPKASNLRKIIKVEGVNGNEVLMVGDDECDYQAAEECGCAFIGIANDFNNWNDESFPLLRDLTMLESVIGLMQ